LEYITAIWYILWPFGNLAVIWYNFPRFGILCQEKSGNLAKDKAWNKNPLHWSKQGQRPFSSNSCRLLKSFQRVCVLRFGPIVYNGPRFCALLVWNVDNWQDNKHNRRPQPLRPLWRRRLASKSRLQKV
jgi:hypothetical protein